MTDSRSALDVVEGVDLSGKTCVITGASSGLGRESARALAAAGARVVEGEVALGHAMERFDDDGRLNDRNIEDQVREVVRNLLVEVEANAASRIHP